MGLEPCLDSDLVIKIVKLHRQGHTISSIARQLGLRANCVSIILAYLDIRERRGYSSDLIKKIIEDYEHMSATQISEKYNIPFNSVAEILKCLKIRKARVKKAVKQEQSDLVDRIRELSLKNYSDDMIAIMLNISVHKVRKIRKIYNIVKSFEQRSQQVNKLVELLKTHGVVDSFTYMKLTNKPLYFGTVIDAINKLREEGIEAGYCKIRGTSSAVHAVLPPQWNQKFIVYLKSREKDALLHLLMQANPEAKLVALRNRVEGPLRELIPDSYMKIATFLPLRDLIPDPSAFLLTLKGNQSTQQS